MQTVQSLPFVVDEPAAQCWIERLLTTGAEICAVGWINQHDTSLLRAKGEALRLVKRALQAEGVALVDSSQVVVLERKGTEAFRPEVIEPVSVAEVEASEDDALNALIESERDAEPAEDLLREDALKE